MPKILMIQGANTHLLGIGQPKIYGTTTAAELDAMIDARAAGCKIELGVVYINSEADLVDRASRAAADSFEAIVTNTGSFCYASYPSGIASRRSAFL